MAARLGTNGVTAIGELSGMPTISICRNGQILHSVSRSIPHGHRLSQSLPLWPIPFLMWKWRYSTLMKAEVLPEPTPLQTACWKILPVMTTISEVLQKNTSAGRLMVMMTSKCKAFF